MRRREFISLLGGTAATWPFTARAQNSKMPVIGFLATRGRDDDPQLLAAFRQGLNESGYIDGTNVTFEYRFAENQYDRLSGLAADLVQRQVAVIAANGPAAQIARATTKTIPIVFTAGFDPVKVGLVVSLSQPGGNATGVTILDVELGPKRLELLHALAPTAKTFGVLVNPSDSSRADIISKEMQSAAQSLGLQLHILQASTDSEFDAVFKSLSQLQAAGLVIGGEPFFNSRSKELGALSVQHAVPTVYQLSSFAEAGGLMSYGASLTDAYRLSGIYVGRILRGETPSDLPVERATKVEMIINLKTAKALGLSIPLDILGRADKVIE
jgi:putative ABC transport system substrate-binding protein